MSTTRGPAPLGAYAQTITAAGLCFVSGQVPVDDAGRHSEDVTGQAEQVFANLAACLADEALTMADVVSITTFLRDIADGPTVSSVRGRFFGDHRPTSTVVEVSGLLDPAWRLEVQAIAVTRDQD
ncbi:RidA family protein [Nocardioides carbamazepini]|uniref:RidA family protein n=1 Tax=Nocardioides carbamazepini TaxID=2854259 RepID=UPI00214A71E9|nr:RidA family protein [Nocardioides carbamazepini]MCR1784790.1 RidA family protein [Nocardioides carbamazepini]